MPGPRKNIELENPSHFIHVCHPEEFFLQRWSGGSPTLPTQANQDLIKSVYVKKVWPP